MDLASNTVTETLHSNKTLISPEHLKDARNSSHFWTRVTHHLLALQQSCSMARLYGMAGSSVGGCVEDRDGLLCAPLPFFKVTALFTKNGNSI